MDKYRIDSHKLIYHVPRVNDWLSGKIIFPLYMEISPSGMCNHRCTFCALDFVGYQKRFLDADLLKKRLTEMGKFGVKSIMYGGEGEPFLHRDMVSITRHTKQSGIDVAFTTNGVLFKPSIAEEVMENTEWIKVSFNAGSPETYSKVHRTKEADFKRVLDNLESAATIKHQKGFSCTLGLQILLLPENQGELNSLARIAKNVGVDYLVVKPYSHHPASVTDKYKDVNYEKLNCSLQDLQQYNDDSFQVIVRQNTIKKWDEKERTYQRCMALPFWSYIDTGGNVWGCSIYLGDERFLYGNIYENSFSEIWQGEKRLKSLEWVENELDATHCRVNCRMDEVNRYLSQLKEPPAHVNFI